MDTSDQRPLHDDSGVEPKAGQTPLSVDELRRIDAWWRAANYLNVGQIYLKANPLLREKLSADHIKPRLLAYWGASPGLNLVYVHLNWLIRKYDLNAIYMAGPGHGGPALIAKVWLEGSYTEHYQHITRDETGMLRLFRQFSTPGGCQAMSAYLRRARFTKVANSAMSCCTPSVL